MPSPNPRGAALRTVDRVRMQREIMDAWCKDIGGVEVLTPAELTMLERAALLAIGPMPRKNVDRVRFTNVITRALTMCGLLGEPHRRREPKLPPEELPSWARKLESAR